MSESGSFHEIAKSVRIEFPIPFLSVALGAIALGCFGLTAIIPGLAVLAACGIGTLAGLAAVGLPVWAALNRPELLRSERHILMSRAFDVILDKQATQGARSIAGRIVEDNLITNADALRVPHPPEDNRITSGTENEDGQDERTNR